MGRAPDPINTHVKAPPGWDPACKCRADGQQRHISCDVQDKKEAAGGTHVGPQVRTQILWCLRVGGYHGVV